MNIQEPELQEEFLNASMNLSKRCGSKSTRRNIQYLFNNTEEMEPLMRGTPVPRLAMESKADIMGRLKKREVVS